MIVADFPIGGHEEDVLRLEVGVGQLAVVQEPDGVAQLIRNVSNLVQRVRVVVVLFL